MSPRDLDEISYEDAMTCWQLYQQGMAGPSVNYLTTYPIMAHLHNLTQTYVASKKKGYKPEPPGEFDTVFPQAFDILTLQKRKTIKELSKGTQAVMALEGAPQWLLEAAQQELEDARTNTGHTN